MVKKLSTFISLLTFLMSIFSDHFKSQNFSIPKVFSHLILSSKIYVKIKFIPIKMVRQKTSNVLTADLILESVFLDIKTLSLCRSARTGVLHRPPWPHRRGLCCSCTQIIKDWLLFLGKNTWKIHIWNEINSEKKKTK